MLDNLNDMQVKLEQLQRDSQNASRREKRLRFSVDDVMKKLKHTNTVSANLQQHLYKYKDLPAELYTRGRKGAFSDRMRQFALTMHLYGPKAYEFAAKHFSLPNVSTLRR